MCKAVRKASLGGESRHDSFLHSNADLIAGEIVHIPCPVSAQGLSFYHFGLHEYARAAPGNDLLKVTVTSSIKCPDTPT